MKLLYTAIIICLCLFTVRAQTLTDGLMMQKDNFCTGFLYTHDQWTQYWEGSLKRDNGNIGKVTTQSLVWAGNYGITNRLNVIAMVPYVRTKASQGTLAGMEGLQDLTAGVKYNFFTHLREGVSKFKLFAVAQLSTPLNDYTPDFLPLSIGMSSTNVAGRITTFYKHDKQGWFANASFGYTVRSNVQLDRPSYFTNDRIYFTNEVDMPNVFDAFISAGYLKNGLQAEVNFTGQNTLGGDDIRRQDMPFVSNRMNFSKVGVLVMYYLPALPELALRASGSYTVYGRNVGESTTLLVGVLYTFKFNNQ